jgi:predicted dehydrogenase
MTEHQTMNELTVAVIGCAGAGRLHLNGWALQSGIRIAAVCDSDSLVVARTALKLQGTAAFTDVRSLLASDKFDIVDVCVPLEERADAVVAALRAGANVVCETPIATTSAEARSLVTVAAEKERLLMPAYIHRFHPPILFARELLDNDDLGRPVSFRCRFSDSRTFLQPGASSVSPVLAGVMRETGQHGIDLFRALFGEVTRAAGVAATVTPGLAVDDSAIIALRSGTDTLGVVEVSQNLPGSRNVVEIYGTVGACLLDYDAGTVRFRDGEHPIWQTHDVSGLNGLEACLSHFADAVRGLQALVVSGEDSARALEVVEGLELDSA